MMQETAVPGPQGTLNVARGPASGPPLALFHGVLRGWRDFAPLLPAWLPRQEVFAIDFRGHGRSDRGSGFQPERFAVEDGCGSKPPPRTSCYRVLDYVEDAVAVLQTIDRPTVVYGHSLGAMVAAASAAQQPERVHALILEDPPFETMGARIRETPFHSQFLGLQPLAGSSLAIPDLARELAEVRIVNPATGQATRLGDVRDPTALRFSARYLREVDPRVLLPIVAGEWLAGYDLDAVLRGIRCPTLVLQADPACGGMLTDVDADRLRQSIADCTCVRLPGVGHLIHWQATEATLRLVTGFLESLS